MIEELTPQAQGHVGRAQIQAQDLELIRHEVRGAKLGEHDQQDRKRQDSFPHQRPGP